MTHKISLRLTCRNLCTLGMEYPLMWTMDFIIGYLYLMI